jgi:hypothetical protein
MIEKLIARLAPFKLYLIGALVGAVALFTYKVLDWRADAHKLADEIAQHKADNEQCEKDKTTTKEAQDELQANYDSIARRLAAAKRVQQSCIPITPSVANALGGGAEHARGNGKGLTSDWLLEYAAKCEQYRSERIALEKFLAAQ